MAKITFRQTIHALLRTKIIAFLPLLGGLVFIPGSVLFWPDVHLKGPVSAGSYGAGLFVVGSAFYFIAPLFDFIDTTFDIADLDAVPSAGAGDKKKYSSADAPQFWETMHKAQLKRSQRANQVLYMVAGICFTVGSFFFFPWMRANVTHGAWLYMMGCVISRAHHPTPVSYTHLTLPTTPYV